MQNLRDKLMKAGLVTPDQVKKVETTPAKSRPPPPRDDRAREKALPPARPAARPPPERRDRNDRHERSEHRRPEREVADARPIPKLPPLALPGSKAYQRLESLKQLEQDKRLRELVHSNSIPIEPGEHRFHFLTRKNRLRRLELSDAQAKLLEEGKLAVVERPEPATIEHSLVPPDIAEKMLALSEKSVRFFNRDGKPIGFVTDDELESRAGEDTTVPEARDPEEPHGEEPAAGEPASSESGNSESNSTEPGPSEA